MPVKFKDIRATTALAYNRAQNVLNRYLGALWKRNARARMRIKLKGLFVISTCD